MPEEPIVWVQRWIEGYNPRGCWLYPDKTKAQAHTEYLFGRQKEILKNQPEAKISQPYGVPSPWEAGDELTLEVSMKSHVQLNYWP